MYALYKETHPPTAVEHCVSCSFLQGGSGGERNLVTAAASYLRVYRMKKVPVVSSIHALGTLALVVCTCLQVTVPLDCMLEGWAGRRLNLSNFAVSKFVCIACYMCEVGTLLCVEEVVFHSSIRQREVLEL